MWMRNATQTGTTGSGVDGVILDGRYPALNELKPWRGARPIKRSTPLARVERGRRSSGERPLPDLSAIKAVIGLFLESQLLEAAASPVPGVVVSRPRGGRTRATGCGMGPGCCV